MADSASFEAIIQDVLIHLYDPGYAPPEQFWTVLGVKADKPHPSLHDLLTDAIEAMKPAEDVPDTSRLWRYYQLLSSRYVQELTQKETAQQLNITPRHLRREQNQAVATLARRLWDSQDAGQGGAATDDKQADPWAAQMRDELAVLYDRDPNASANVATELGRVIKLVEAVLNQRGIALSADECEKGLIVRIHPSVLRQILIAAVEDLAEHMTEGVIHLRAVQSADNAEIELTGSPVALLRNEHDESIWNILATEEGVSEFSQSRTDGSIRLRIPLSRPILVLVIDDNADVVHVYRRYTAGTPYQIVHLEQFSNTLAETARARPDMVVLDVMMPNADGWELLADLRRHPATRHIPVIICSVIRQEEFAKALGAAAHLAKPVKSQLFLKTLDQVWLSTLIAGRPAEFRSEG